MGNKRNLSCIVGIGALYASAWFVLGKSLFPADVHFCANILICAAQLPIFILLSLKPLKISGKAFLIVSILSATVQVVSIATFSVFPNLAYGTYLAGGLLFGFQRAISVFCWCSMMRHLSYDDIQKDVSLGMGFGSAVCMILISLEGVGSQVVSVLIPVLSAIIYIRNSDNNVVRSLTDESECQERTIIPRSFLLSICIVTIANGFMHGDGTFNSLVGSVLVFGSVAACCTLISLSKSLTVPYILSMIATAGGMMFMPYFALGNSLISVGQICLTVIAWVVCIALQKKENKDSDMICGKVWTFFTFSQIIGMVAGSVLSSMENVFAIATLVLSFACLIVFAFTLYEPFLYVVRSGVNDTEARSDYDAKILEIATSCHLTLREREILELLAYGRDYRYIETTLCISSNTVKTHLRNIYGKAGVSNRQEMLSKIKSAKPKEKYR